MATRSNTVFGCVVFSSYTFLFSICTMDSVIGFKKLCSVIVRA